MSGSLQSIMLTSVSELMAVLTCNDAASLNQGLGTLKRQWSMHSIETAGRVTEDLPAFAPLLRYVNSEPDMPHFFKLLGDAYSVPSGETSLLTVAVFGLVLEALRRSSHRGIASKVARKFIQEHMKLFYRFLSSGHTPIIAPTLDLMTAVASVDPSVNEAFFAVFDFGLKTFPKFATMRKRRLATGERHDIRSAHVHFILCFLEHGGYGTKQALAKMQGMLGPIFAGLADDAFGLADWILGTVWKGVVLNEKRTKALSVSFFYSSTLTKIAKLLDSGDDNTAMLADGFLRALCTNEESGLLYPISADHQPGLIKNKIILEFLLTLGPLESVRKQTLCLDLLEACPDLFTTYLGRAGFVLDPEPSIRFVNLSAYVAKLYQGTPVLCSYTRLQVEDIVVLKCIHGGASFTRGLSHANRLVVYSTTLVFKAMMRRALQLLSLFEGRLLGFPEAKRQDLLQGREAFLRQLQTILPDAKSLHALLQFSCSAATAKEDLIGQNVCDILVCYQKLFGHLIVVPKLALVAVGDVSDALKRCLGQLLAVTGSLADSGFELAILKGLVAGHRGIVAEYLRNALLLTGLLRDPTELLFWSELLQTVSDAEACQLVEDLRLKLDALQKTRFLPRSEGSSPILLAFGEDLQQSYSRFRAAAQTAFPFTLSPTGQRPIVAFELSAEQAMPHESDRNVDLLGHTFEAVTDELFSQLRPDLVIKSLKRHAYDTFTPFAPTADDRLEVLRRMLVELDPALWLQFLANLLSGSSWTGDLHVMIDSGALAFAILGLAASSGQLRLASHHVLALFNQRMEKAFFRERREIGLLLSCLHHSLLDDSQISLFTATFFAEGLQVLLRPTHFMYGPLMEFLLAHFRLDLRHLPMLPECLGSPSDEHFAKRQLWMLRILTSALRDPSDFDQVCLASHLMDRVLEALLTPSTDRLVEQACRRFLLAVLGLGEGTAAVLRERHGLVAWAEMLPASRAALRTEILTHMHLQ